ncbi:MAG TPA: LamG domain-containing protein [Lacunisphaera sp.]|nr:LamG domain-containing protein [Lacunisphaera sp.]
MKTPLLLAGLFCVAVAVAAEPVVWRLDHADRIGGQATEVLGAPTVGDGPGGKAMWFNGTSDGLYVPVNPLQGLEAFTIEALFNPEKEGPAEQRFLHVQDNVGAAGDPGSRGLLEIRLADGSWALDGFLYSTVTKGRIVLFDATKRHPAGQWTWVAMVYDHGHATTYVNGVKELDGPIDFPPMGAGRVSLGVRQNKVSWFKGGLAEVRWHATALPLAQLQRRPSP